MLVKVYRNLHNSLLSVVALTGKHKGKVIAHCESVKLHFPEFIVSEAGARRVRMEKQKNVHAYAKGTLKEVHGLKDFNGRGQPLQGYAVDSEVIPSCWVDETITPVTYNPYKAFCLIEVNSGVTNKPFNKPMSELTVHSNGIMWATHK